MGPMPERKAERVMNGVLINLNHERYYTRIVTDRTEFIDEKANA